MLKHGFFVRFSSRVRMKICSSSIPCTFVGVGSLMAGPPVEKKNTLTYDLLSRKGLQPGFYSKFTANPRGKILFKIIDPILSIRPPAGPLFRAIDLKGFGETPRISKGHHLFRESNAHLSDSLHDPLRAKRLNLRSLVCIN
jgi:hypothetical protein